MAKKDKGDKYKDNYLEIFKDSIVKQNQNTTVDYYTEQTFKITPSFRMITAYDSENSKIKAKLHLYKTVKTKYS